ncbi:MAG: hypothetical protein ACYC2H_06035 [Thermoplasmatota archaeon]
MMRPFVATALLLLGFSTVPNAAAQDLGIDLADPGILDCYSYMADAQHDGQAEQWRTCSTPTCGCDCPYVGAGVVVEAADQQTGVAAATSGCQTAYSTTRGEGDGGPPATVWPIMGGGILRDIETAISLP